MSTWLQDYQDAVARSERDLQASADRWPRFVAPLAGRESRTMRIVMIPVGILALLILLPAVVGIASWIFGIWMQFAGSLFAAK